MMVLYSDMEIHNEIAHRLATVEDYLLLARMNQQFLLEDGHRHVFLPGLGETPDAIPLARLEERMRRWLSRAYSGVIFTEHGDVIAYGLYNDGEYELELQQFYVIPERRREGIGRRCFEILRSEYWPRDKRIALGVLAENKTAQHFWRAMGFIDYSYELFIPAGR